MSDSSQEPWSNNPYAPQITYRLYFAEQMNFAGFLVGAISYGIVIVLFFWCMAALLDPINRTRGGIKWGLVVHTIAMFSFVTIYTATNLDIQSFSYIDYREFPGSPGNPPGPFGYQLYTYSQAICVVPSVVFTLNNWLADGLLLYRCWIAHAMNYWVIVLPCMMYITTFAMGIGFIYQLARPISLASAGSSIQDFGTPYYSISLSLNVILTIMITTRLALHSKNVRTAMGTPGTTGGVYKAIITMLIESCALYAVSYLLFVAPWASQSSVSNAFFPILAETQVIAPFLIVLRVADRRALTSDGIASGKASSLHFGSQRDQTSSGGTLSSERTESATVMSSGSEV